jgi:hypothetical protein
MMHGVRPAVLLGNGEVAVLLPLEDAALTARAAMETSVRRLTLLNIL